MLKLVLGFSWVLAGTVAWAQDAEVSRTEVTTTDEGALRHEVMGFRPQLGITNFTDVLGQSQTKGSAGLTWDINFAAASHSFYFGPSTGAIYTHVGRPDSNFIGTGSNLGGPDAHMVQIPLNGKLGVQLTDGLRIGGHGGGNLIWRSSAPSVQLSPESTFKGGADWTVFPNVGADLEIAISRGASILLRPDWTFSSGEDLFTATLGFSASLG